MHQAFESLSQEVRAIVFDLALVGVSALIFHASLGLTDKHRNDPELYYAHHIIPNLCLLRFGYLPTLQLTKQARDVFWTYNIFQMTWDQNDPFALGFGTPQRAPASHFIPRDYVRRLKIEIPTRGQDPQQQRWARYDDDRSVIVRQLLDFPTLQKLEIAIRISLLSVSSTNPNASFRVNEIKDVCMRLMKRYGNSFPICLEASIYNTSKNHPYPWQCLPIQNFKVDPDDVEKYRALYEGPEDNGKWFTCEYDDGPAYLLESATYFREPYEPPDDEVAFDGNIPTWIWLPPTEKTMERVQRGRANWMENFNVELFHPVLKRT